VKYATLKAFQVDSALHKHVETHFFIAEFPIIDHEHEICKQHLLKLVVVVLSDLFLDRRETDCCLDHIQKLRFPAAKAKATRSR
jgi:hypothetical protein